MSAASTTGTRGAGFDRIGLLAAEEGGAVVLVALRIAAGDGEGCFGKPTLEPSSSVSMDGRGRCLDNVFVERLWRTVKYEYVYLWRPEAVPVLAAGLKTYFGFYNEQRAHQSLKDRTPAEVYRKGSR